MFHKSKNFLICFLAILTITGNACAEQMSQKLWGGLKQEDVATLKKFNDAIDNNDYKTALNIVNSITYNSNFSDTMSDIALWNKYSGSGAKTASFNDISKFVNDYQFFPNLGVLRKNAEEVAIANKIPYSFSQQYFNNFPATSSKSKMYLLESEINYLNGSKNPNFNNPAALQQDIQNSIIDIWTNENFSSADEEKFLQNYGPQLSEENHIKRISRLLWDGKNSDAKRILNLVNEDHQRLFSAIIQFSEGSKSISDMLSDAPRNLRDNDLLACKIILWKKSRIKNDDDLKSVVDLLKTIPANVDYPDKWWGLRNLYAREMIKKRDYGSAYDIVVNHGLKVGSNNYSDAEWMAGWIALRFLDKPKIAYKHFNNVYLNVSYPISISRAVYWMGMAQEEMGNNSQAIEWYKIAAKYPTYFYGQLGIHKHRLLDSVGSIDDIILPKDPDILGSDMKAISQAKSVKIAYVLSLMGDYKTATKILEYAVAKATSDGQIAVIMKIVNEMGNKELDVKVSKFAAKRNVFFIKDKFQIIKDIQDDKYAPLVHAIIKQESGFATTALSSVGAVGFMQLMPKTAELVCKKMGVKYNRHKLASDVNYNVILGSYYIKSLIDDFDGSEMMAIAAYNAGPGAVQRWVKEFYDPREMDDLDKVVDWIELITYSETRNYVQRIMENLIVYKYLMSRMNYDQVK